MNQKKYFLPANSNQFPFNVAAFEGGVVEPNNDVWRVIIGGDVCVFDFRTLNVITAESFLFSVKSTILWYVQNQSARTARGNFNVLRKFIQYLAHQYQGPIAELKELDFLNYKMYLKQEGEHYLARLRSVIYKWDSLGYPGLKDNVTKTLKLWRLKGGEKGVSVKIRCSQTGPFTELELEATITALNKAFAENKFSTELFLATWLYILFGVRPRQLVLMKVKDFSAVVTRQGSKEFLLMVPRAKQRYQKARTELKARALTGDVAALLGRQIDSVKIRFKDSDVLPEELPIFPAAWEDQVMEFAEGYIFHTTSSSLQTRMLKVWRSIEAYSERTGEKIHYFPTRFRRTLGTRAAAAGRGPLVVAELLDHSDTQNVMVYIESRPDMIERIDSALAMELAPLAQAFMGKVIENPHPDDDKPQSEREIVDFRFDKSMKPFASCTELGVCEFDAPIACYVCSHFQPWVDGPHKQVLDYLIEQRNTHLSAGRKEIAKINDRTILAVAQVIQKCQGMKEQSDA